MRLLYLFLRSRRTERSLALLLLLGTATLLWRRLSDGNPLNNDLMITALPAAAAVVIGASVGSPFRDVEDAASHPVPALRMPQMIGLLILAAGVLGVATAAWPVPDIQWSLVRNVILFTGLALLGARLVGAGLSWLFPVAYGFLAFLATLLAASQPHHQLQWTKPGVRWAWSLQAGTEHEAAMVASVILVIGAGVVAWYGGRDRLEESV